MKKKMMNCSIPRRKGIADALALYLNNNTPRSKLLSDYADARLMTFSTPALNPWLERNAQKGIEVEQGMTADETEFIFAAYQIRDYKPTDVIEALFYENRNDSGIECGIVYELLTECMPSNKRLLLVNPSPFFLTKIAGENGYKNITGLVKDSTLSKLYKNEFPQFEFFPYDDYPNKDIWESILIFQRDEKQTAKLYKQLSFLASTGNVIAYIGNKEIENESIFRNAVKDNNLYLRDIYILPSEVTESVPKKKSIAVLDRKTPALTVCHVFNYIPEDKNLEEEKSISLSYENIFKSGKSLIQISNAIKNDSIFTSTLVTRIRKERSTYHFSKEIAVEYSIITRGSGYSANVRFSSIEKGKNKYGKKLVEIKEKGLCGKTEADVLEKIKKIVFEEKFSEAIVHEMKTHYADSGDLSLKTGWFCNRDLLAFSSTYNEEDVLFILENSEIAELPISSITDTQWVRLVRNGFRDSDKFIRQLNLIFSVFQKNSLISSNPLEEYCEQFGNRRNKRQKQVVDALGKRMLETEEENRIMKYLFENITCDNGETLPHCVVNPECFSGLMKYFSPFTRGELCALKFSDLIFNPDLNLYQIWCNHFLNSKGDVMEYTANNENAIRFFPLPFEIAEIWRRRKKYLSRISNYCEQTIDSWPVVQSSNSQKKMMRNGKPEFCTPGKLYTVLESLLTLADIESQELLLPGKHDITVNINHTKGDFFRKNFQYHAKYDARLNEGEINFLLGIAAPQGDTYAKHYCDYNNELVQYALSNKLRRWTSRFERLYPESTSNSLKEISVYLQNDNDTRSLAQFTVQNDFGHKITCQEEIKLDGNFFE